MSTFVTIRDAVKAYSVQGLAVAASMQGALMLIPDALQRFIPTWAGETVVMAAILYALVGRFMPQATVAEKV